MNACYQLVGNIPSIPPQIGSTGRRGSNSDIGCQEMRLLCGYDKQRMPKGHCNLLVCCWGQNTPFPSVLKKLGSFVPLRLVSKGCWPLVCAGVPQRSCTREPKPKLGDRFAAPEFDEGRSRLRSDPKSDLEISPETFFNHSMILLLSPRFLKHAIIAYLDDQSWKLWRVIYAIRFVSYQPS